MKENFFWTTKKILFINHDNYHISKHSFSIPSNFRKNAIPMLETAEIEKIETQKQKEYIRTDNLLFRTTSNYIRLIGDSDRKARITIVVNSILITVIITLLTGIMKDYPYSWISAVLLLCTNLLTLFFSLVSVKPNLHGKKWEGARNTMLHYSTCRNYSLEDYDKLMKDMLKDDEKKMDAIIKDLYFYGNILHKKYRLMKVAFRIFLWGIVSSVASYLIILLVVGQA